jgi:hypothetical protein
MEAILIPPSSISELEGLALGQYSQMYLVREIYFALEFTFQTITLDTITTALYMGELSSKWNA